MIQVMIVEDDPMAQKLLEIFVSGNSNYQVVHTIESAAMAEFYCMTNKIDLILMDVCTAMNVSGVEAAEKIKSRYPYIKIIIITSQPECSFIDRARSAGISDTIARAVNSFSVLAEKNGYTFNVNCEGKYFVTGDEARIQQVIYNLISNAINYTGDDKTVTISTHLQENMLRISVTDTGKGISDEDKALVWDRYYKSSSSHHRMQVGTGIGLSIVKNTLLLHKSDFGIISEPGSGSTFWFELPVAENI